MKLTGIIAEYNPFHSGHEFHIKKAKELLSNTNHSIKDISRMVGYTDSNYFAKIFKRLVGEIPSKYRENLTENA